MPLYELIMVSKVTTQDALRAQMKRIGRTVLNPSVHSAETRPPISSTNFESGEEAIIFVKPQLAVDPKVTDGNVIRRIDYLGSKTLPSRMRPYSLQNNVPYEYYGS